MKNKLRILKAKLRANITNSRGWSTKRKLLVIESDDWGCIRMPSKAVFDTFVKKGYSIENSLYNRYDSLASAEDLNFLFETLSNFKDIRGESLKITANTIVANPNFEKIKENNFNDYFYEPFTETLEKYSEHKGAFDLWRKGIDEKLFVPQFHGREHLNIKCWMQAIQSDENDVIRDTFEYGTTYSGKFDYNFMEAFDNKPDEIKTQHIIIKEGLALFEKIFGFKSRSFIAPCYVWHPDLNKTLKENGVDYLQGIRFQFQPTEEHFKYNKLAHHLGEKNSFDQLYLVRNTIFEPSSIHGMDWVSYAFAQIETAFAWGKPAIISSHRLNYIGFIEKKNRDKNLKLLIELINKVQKKWPDVEFISSDELGDIIKES